MAIIGLTNEKDGSPRMHRTVVTKIAIGLPPSEGANYPKKLDHFVFLRQVMVGKELQWQVDPEKQEHYGTDCKSFWIVFLSDNIEEVFRTELAAYVKTRCWCRGDGEKAQRRKQADKEWPPKGDFEIYKGPCANNGCKDFEPQNDKPAACKPSADLYFLLQDFPTLGTICRIHTSSYQSIRQINTALLDLQAVTGGRLMGVRAKLFVMPARNVFEQKGKEQTGTKYVLGLELAAKDIPQLMEAMASTAVQFQGLQKQLAGHVLEIEEDDETRAPEIAAEFYHDKSESQVVQEDPEAALKAEADELLKKKRPDFNEAKRMMKISQWSGKLPDAIANLKKLPDVEAPAAAKNNAPVVLPPVEQVKQTPPAETPARATPKPNINGEVITDADFPEGMFDEAEQGEQPKEETAPATKPVQKGLSFDF